MPQLILNIVSPLCYHSGFVSFASHDLITHPNVFGYAFHVTWRKDYFQVKEGTGNKHSQQGFWTTVGLLPNIQVTVSFSWQDYCLLLFTPGSQLLASRLDAKPRWVVKYFSLIKRNPYNLKGTTVPNRPEYSLEMKLGKIPLVQNASAIYIPLRRLRTLKYQCAIHLWMLSFAYNLYNLKCSQF